MDENKSPQDFLNEIFEKSEAAAPPMPQPRFELPGDDPPPAPPPDGPAGKHGSEAGAALLPWLCVMLGVALLVLGVCLLQLVRINHRLDGLQQAVEAVQSVDGLRKENEQLQEQLDQAEQELEQLQQAFDYTSTQRGIVFAQKRQLDYLWYMGQFMEHGDYPMAAMVASLSAYQYFSGASGLADVPDNPPHTEQYQAYCQELLDRGYLQEPSSGYLTWGGANYECTEKYDPSKDPDMAALGILWCAVDEYYVAGAPGAAAQYLIRYQWYELYSPGESGGDCYPQRILDTASDYTIQQYERLIQYLIASGWLTERDGILSYSEDQGHVDVLYNLPFDPPGGYLYGQIPLG